MPAAARRIVAIPASLDGEAPFFAEVSPASRAAALRLFYSPFVSRWVLAPADEMEPALSLAGNAGSPSPFFVDHHRAFSLVGLRGVFYSSALSRWILTEQGKGLAEPRCYCVPGGRALEGDGYWLLNGMSDAYSAAAAITGEPAGAYASDPFSHPMPALAWSWAQVWIGPARFPAPETLAEGVAFAFAGTGTGAESLIVRGPVARETVYVAEVSAWR